MGSEGAKQFINLILQKKYKDFDLNFRIQLSQVKNTQAFQNLVKLNSKLG
jgi:hypothetical protein